MSAVFVPFAVVKWIGTKARSNGGFAFAWLTTALCARLQCPNWFMNKPAIKYPKLKWAIHARVPRGHLFCSYAQISGF